MEFKRKQVLAILEALKANPRGLNVSEASRKTGMNRSTVAKYMEMLYFTGYADMRTFGTSKLYYISHRMPISAFLNFTSDLILVLDKDSRVLNANDSFFEFTGTSRDDIVHKYIDNFAFPIKFSPPIEPYIAQAFEGKEASVESYYATRDGGRYFNVKMIPLVFEDGTKGVTLLFEDITEKKLAEKALHESNVELEKKVKERTRDLEKANKALRESEERYRALVEKSYDIVYSVLPDGTISYISPQVARYHYEPGELIGRNVYDFIPADHRKALTQKVVKIKSAGGSSSTEFKLLDKNGEAHWAEAAGKSIYDEAGQPLFMVGMVRDIDERKRLEEALRQSEERLHLAVEGAGMGMWDIDLETGEVYCSNIALRIIGYDAARNPKFSRDELTQLIHPDDLPSMFRSFEKTNREYLPFIHEARIRRADNGEIRWVLFYSRYILDGTGKALHMVGIIQDITERKNVEEALRTSEARFRSLFEGASVAILIIDVETRTIVDCNSNAARLVGRGREELIGMLHKELHPEEDHAACRKNSRIHSPDGIVTNHEADILHKDGRRIPVLINSTVMELGGRMVMMGSYLDITERKRMEKALESERLQLLSIFDSIDESIYVADPNTYEILFVNKSMRDHFDENLVGKTCYEKIQLRDSPCDFCTNPFILNNGGQPYNWEFHNPIANKDFMIYDRIIRWPDGRDVRFELAIDVTERKRVEKALIREKHILTKSQEIARVGNWALDLQEGIFTGSAENDRIFGFEPGDGTRTAEWVLSRVLPEDRMTLLDLMKARMRDGERDSLDFRIVRPDGSIGYVNAIVDKVVRDREGRVIRLYGISQDVTERKRIEEALIEEKYVLTRSQEVAHIGNWVLDTRTGNLVGSAENERIMGYEPGPRIPTMEWFFPHVVSEDRAMVIDFFQSRQENGKPGSINYRIKRPDGSVRYVRSSVDKAARDDAGKVIRLYGIAQDITEHKLVEEALRESEEKFRVLAETSPAAIFLYQDEKYVYVNPMAEALTGYTREELLAGDAWEWIHSADRSMVRGRAIKRQRGEQLPTQYEVRYRTKDGRDGWVDFAAGRIDYMGKPAGLATAFDVTKRKQAEEALRESEEKYRSLVENIGDMVWETDADHKCTYASSKTRDLLGDEPEEVLGKTPFQYVAPEDIDRAIKAIEPLLARHEPFGLIEYTVVHKDGKRIVVESSGTPVFDRDGQFKGYRGVNRDITVRKRAEEALRESEARYRKLVENNPVLIWETDPNNRFTFINIRSNDVLGFEPEEILGRTPFEFLVPGEALRILQLVKPSLDEHRAFNTKEYYMIRKDGTRICLHTVGLPIFDDQGQLIGYRGTTREVKPDK